MNLPVRFTVNENHREPVDNRPRASLKRSARVIGNALFKAYVHITRIGGI